jgi:hypothetical protein
LLQEYGQAKGHKCVCLSPWCVDTIYFVLGH